MSTKALRLERHLPQSPESVWRAWTDPAAMSLWYCPNPQWSVTATTDLRIGGRWQIRMGPHVVAGRYTALEAPHRLSFTWRWEAADDRRPSATVADPVDSAAAYSLVEVLIELDGSGSRLILTHTELPDEDELKGHQQGWELSLDRLAAGPTP